MGLDLDVVPNLRGRKKVDIPASVTRELVAGDFDALQVERGTKPPALKRLSDRHHSIARLVAGGATNAAISAIVGINPSRVSILRTDPAFTELVEFYRGKQDEIYFDMHEQLAGLSADALIELRDRLEEEPESFTNGMLLEVLTKTADRSGHGPSSEQKVNVNFGIADRLEKARKRHKEKVLELEATPGLYEDVLDD